MRNKRFAVLAMAAIMAASSAMLVMADDDTVEIETSENQGGHEETQETGDVSTSEEKQNGISAANESVTRDEDVTGEQDGINAVDKSEVTVDGNVTGEHYNGIDARDSNVTVRGDVTGKNEIV